MRSNGLATVLLMVPVLTVPALAIFGIPQFAPVVASPLDEGTDFERDHRGGSSPRLSSRDDLFGDVEGFGSDSDMIDEPPAKKRKSSLSGKSQRSLRSKGASAPSWNDDLNSSSDSTNRKRMTASNIDEFSDQDSPPMPKSPRKPLALEKSSQDKQRPSQSSKGDGLAQLGTPAEIDSGLNSSGSGNDNSFDNERSPANDDRPRGNELRRTKPRATAETLSWSAAVDRLNQLEIRNFRLEPGRQPGQFMFICVYTARDNPGVMHRFEAEAEQPLKAVENVLDQIAEWQQRR